MRGRCGLAKGLVLIAAALAIIYPIDARAQGSSLRVQIGRPVEGETLYISSTAPYATSPVSGWVSSDEFAPAQLQVRLELFQGTKSFGTLTTQPLAGGEYSFSVAINPSRPATKASGEYHCESDCHAVARLGYPPGAVLLAVTVTDPLGRKATAQRSIVVEHSGYAEVPIRVVTADDRNHPVDGMNVVGATWLYNWRAREYSARTDAAGSAVFHVEALGQSTTRYTFVADPFVHDGVLYKSRGRIQVSIPPGALQVAPVTILVEAQLGEIDGLVMVGDSPVAIPLTVRAIELVNGVQYTSRTVEGEVHLADLPLSRYILTIDQAELSAHGWQADPLTVDLSASPNVSPTLKLASAATRTIRGVVHDGAGEALPFAWITSGAQNKSVCLSPFSGDFVFHGLVGDARSLWVTAPGYWSRPVPAVGDRLDIVLSRQPDTRTIPWGAGTVVVPLQTNATVTAGHVDCKRGWVWGSGSGALSIDTPDLNVALMGGAFALEYWHDGISRLYMREGQAAVTAGNQKITVAPGRMLAFGKGVERLSPVDVDSGALSALLAGQDSPVPVETDPAPIARVRDALAQWGFPDNLLLYLALFLGVAILVVWLRTRASQAHPVGN